MEVHTTMKKGEKVITYEQTLETVGEHGLWQKINFLQLALPAAVSTMAVFMYEFVAFTPPHRKVLNDDKIDSMKVHFIITLSFPIGAGYPRVKNWKLPSFTQTIQSFRDLLVIQDALCIKILTKSVKKRYLQASYLSRWYTYNANFFFL